MKEKKKVYPRDQKLHEELEKGRPDGEKRFFALLKKAVQPQLANKSNTIKK
jgi:hypothetical protein